MTAERRPFLLRRVSGRFRGFAGHLAGLCRAGGRCSARGGRLHLCPSRYTYGSLDALILVATLMGWHLPSTLRYSRRSIAWAIASSCGREPLVAEPTSGRSSTRKPSGGPLSHSLRGRSGRWRRPTPTAPLHWNKSGRHSVMWLRARDRTSLDARGLGASIGLR
jgi:hypothetical protein